MNTTDPVQPPRFGRVLFPEGLLDGRDDVVQQHAPVARDVENPGFEGGLHEPGNYGPMGPHGSPTEPYLRSDQATYAPGSPWVAGPETNSGPHLSESGPDSDPTDAAGAPTSQTFAQYDVPGADPGDDVEPFEVVSTPEHVEAARAFFAGQKAAQSKKQNERGRKRSGVFSLMQYLDHPETGEPMYSQDQLDVGLEAFGDCLHKWAYVWHLRDRIVDVDEGTEEPYCIGIKGPHVHVVLWFHREMEGKDGRPRISEVADAFTIPSARVKPPKEEAAQNGGQTHRGANAAERAFFDLCEYLPHETRRKSGLKGVNMPERSYLVDDKQPGDPGKYQYGRGRVVANFDFGVELDAHMATRAVAADNGMSLKARKTRLRRRVGQDGMTLDEARAADFDAYADDMTRLTALRNDYLSRPENQPKVGTEYRKSLVFVSGRTRSGKDVFAQKFSKWLVLFAEYAGLKWTKVTPAGSNALELVGKSRAEIAHHQDARFSFVKSYDEALRYVDPNNSVEAGTRNTNTPAPVVRAAAMTSTESPETFGLSLLKRRYGDALAADYAYSRAHPQMAGGDVPVDVDEFLLRIGWVVRIETPDEALGDYDAIQRDAVAKISRITDGGPSARRTEPAVNHRGQTVGLISTSHQIEPLAMIRGLEDAAQFLATKVMSERNWDVWDLIDDLKKAEMVAQANQIAEAFERVAAEARAEQLAEGQATLAGIRAHIAQQGQHELPADERVS